MRNRDESISGEIDNQRIITVNFCFKQIFKNGRQSKKIFFDSLKVLENFYNFRRDRDINTFFLLIQINSIDSWLSK